MTDTKTKSKKKTAKTKSTKPNPGEQLDLMNVAPDNVKKIISLAKEYRRIVAERVPLTNKEAELKDRILDEIKKAKLQYVNGKIRFTVDGVKITVTPRDELIKVEDKTDGEDAD